MLYFVSWQTRYHVSGNNTFESKDEMRAFINQYYPCWRSYTVYTYEPDPSGLSELHPLDSEDSVLTGCLS